MNDEELSAAEERLRSWLVTYDKAHAAGTLPEEPTQAEPPEEWRPRLEGDFKCIQLLRQVLPRRGKTDNTATPAAPPFRRLARFEVRYELGHGAFGIVFLAWDPQLGRDVALKVPRPEALLTAELRERFVREARAAAVLDHPHLVPVYEVGTVEPLCYIASAYCPGITLTQWLANRSEAVPLRLAAELVATLAEAVQHAHERGVIHRDLKPSNVLLQRRPPHRAAANSTPGRPDAAFDFVPRITDFGLAKLTAGMPGQLREEDEVRTQSGAILGTPNYMAPEQADGKIREIGPAVDVYALGAILYELLTGRPPFRGETILDTLEQVKNQEPLPFSRLRLHVPRDLQTICLKCLQKDPRQRYASAEDLADDLRRFLDGRPIVARPIGVLASAWLWAHRPERVPGAGVYAVALGVVLILWTLFGLAAGAGGLLPQARPQEAIYYNGGAIALIHCPFIFIGLSTIARKLFSLWLGLVFGSFWLAATLIMANEHMLGLNFDMGGCYSSAEARTPTFMLLSFIALIGVLLYVAALLAYYSNRELMEQEKRTKSHSCRTYGGLATTTSVRKKGAGVELRPSWAAQELPSRVICR